MTKNELFEINIPELDTEAYKRAKKHFDGIAKPIDGLGVFEDIVCLIAAMQGNDTVDIKKKALVIMIADNGVTKEGVSQTDRSVTSSVAALMGKKKSTVCLMAKDYPVDIIPVDVGIDCNMPIKGVIDKKSVRGTKDILKEPAMSTDTCLNAIAAGIDIARRCKDSGIKMLATGEMGIGNTTTACALLCALTQVKVSDVVGRGAGLSDEGLDKKTYVIKQALERNKLNNTPETITASYALSCLEKAGGLDIAGLAGLYIGAASLRMPVVIDGLISAVAALVANFICPGASKYMIASHVGREKGTKAALDALEKTPVLSANMALGEGTGAVMLFPLIDMVMNVYNDGMSFEDTGINRYERFKK